VVNKKRKNFEKGGFLGSALLFASGFLAIAQSGSCEDGLLSEERDAKHSKRGD
jgi:hypothetical protein